MSVYDEAEVYSDEELDALDDKAFTMAQPEFQDALDDIHEFAASLNRPLGENELWEITERIAEGQAPDAVTAYQQYLDVEESVHDLDHGDSGRWEYMSQRMRDQEQAEPDVDESALDLPVDDPRRAEYMAQRFRDNDVGEYGR